MITFYTFALSQSFTTVTSLLQKLGQLYWTPFRCSRKATVPASTSMEKIELRVSLHCKACERTVRKALCRLKGVTCVEVDMKSSKVTVLGYIDKDAAMKEVRRTGRRAEVWSNSCHRCCNSVTDFPQGRFKCIFWKWKKRKDSVIHKLV